MVEHGSDVGFLDRLGQTEYDRIKKREELAKEYAEFKKKDEEKFKNRFADKKRFAYDAPKETSQRLQVISKSSDVTDSKIVQNSPSEGKTKNSGKTIESNTTLTQKFEARISELARKIDLLYEERQSLNRDMINADSKANLTFNGDKDLAPRAIEIMQNSKNNKSNEEYSKEQLKTYERELQRRLRLIKDAEERLLSIEREYTATKMNESSEKNHEINLTLQTIGSSAQQNMDFHTYNQRNHERPMTSQSELHQKQIYRSELEKQILEAKQKRQAEKDMFSGDVSQISLKDNKPEVPLSNKPVMDSDSYKSVNSDGDQEYFLFGKKDLLTTGCIVNDIVPNINEKEINKNYATMQSVKLNNNSSSGLASSKKSQYAQELRQQIEEARRKKALQKKLDEEFDRKVEEECAKYNPFDSSVGISSSKQSTVAPDITSATQAAENESNFARGGHGIFGSPLTDEQKTSLQKYKEDLAQQIAEKKRALEIQKQREMEIEQREAERLAADQVRIQKEFEEEQARRKAKQEEEERLAEQRRKEVELKRKTKQEKLEETKAFVNSAEPIRCVKQEEKLQPKNKVKKQSDRLKSPELLIGPDQVSKSISKQPYSNSREPDGSPIIKQLKNLRSQLDMERLKVQDALMKSRSNSQWEDINASDTTRSHPKVIKKGVELFGENNVQSQKPFKISDTPVLKQWAGEMIKEENRSRLEKQQVACLKAQDEYLAKLKEDLSLLSMKELNNNLVMHNNLRKMSNEQYSGKPVSDPRSNFSESPEEQPHTLIPISSSVSSVNIEEIAAKNEQRLKRLEAMQLLNEIDADPEAVLQRFIEKHDELHSTKHRFPCF